MYDFDSTTIEQELGPSEKLLWSGRPRQGIRLRAADALVIPFSLLWCGFAIFWEVMALVMTAQARQGVAILFPLFGIPFVLAGLYFVFGRFLVDARSRRRTLYGLTNERIILISGLLSRQTKSLNLRTLSDVSLTERSDGSGTITLGPMIPLFAAFAGSWPGTRQFAPPAFELIPDARTVYNLIRDAQKAATS